jgi:hypothetical protein
MAHAFYANMHGFVLRKPNQASPQSGADNSNPTDKAPATESTQEDNPEIILTIS